MAFQTPVALQKAASITPELLPSMSAVLRLPLHGLVRQPTLQGRCAAVPQHALRFSNSIAHASPFSSLATRQYSTFTRIEPRSQFRPVPTVGSVGLSLAQRRTFFGAPSHSTLARLEQQANNNAGSATAQAAFYSALLRANMPQIIIDRHRTGRFATNSAVEQSYQKALEKTGQTDDTSIAGAEGQLSQQQLQAVGQAIAAKVGGGSVGKTRAGAGNKADPLYVVIEESMWSTLSKWARWLLTFSLAAYIGLIMITLFAEQSGLLKKVGGATSAEVRPEQQNTRFSDVHGCEEAKEELQDVVDFLKNPDRYNKLGGRLPKGVLLVGPPGTGKTLLARAVAGEAGVPFFYMSGSEFDEVYVGVGAKRVRELFAAARAKAPAIVFIDELDAVGGKRNSREANYHRQTLNQLLNDLDGFDQSTGVIFIAATNHPEILDKALLRPGRFDRHISVELPDVRGRLAILKYHMKKIRMAPEVDLSKIARGTPGFSGAELENLANSAAIRASKQLSKYVQADDLEWAKDKIMMGAERKSRSVPLKDKLQTAYHEGGHTLVGLYTKGASDLHKATILPRGPAAGITFFLPKEESHMSKAQYYVQLEISMGGRIAEEIVYGAEHVGDGARGDIQSATDVAYRMVTSYGFSDTLGNVDFGSNYERLSPETKKIIDREVRRLIDDAKKNAKQLLLDKRHELDLLAKALVQYETLDKEEILKVIKGEKLEGRMIASDDDIKIPVNPTPFVHIPSSGNPDPPAGTGVPA